MKKILFSILMVYACTANAEMLTCQFQNGSYVKINGVDVNRLYVRLAHIDGTEVHFRYNGQSYQIANAICSLEE